MLKSGQDEDQCHRRDGIRDRAWRAAQTDGAPREQLDRTRHERWSQLNPLFLFSHSIEKGVWNNEPSNIDPLLPTTRHTFDGPSHIFFVSMLSGGKDDNGKDPWQDAATKMSPLTFDDELDLHLRRRNKNESIRHYSMFLHLFEKEKITWRKKHKERYLGRKVKGGIICTWRDAADFGVIDYVVGPYFLANKDVSPSFSRRRHKRATSLVNISLVVHIGPLNKMCFKLKSWRRALCYKINNEHSGSTKSVMNSRRHVDILFSNRKVFVCYGQQQKTLQVNTFKVKSACRLWFVRRRQTRKLKAIHEWTERERERELGSGGGGGVGNISEIGNKQSICQAHHIVLSNMTRCYSIE